MKSAAELHDSIRRAHGKIIESGDDGVMFSINNLKIICSWGCGWDHVSVSLKGRCPTWDEMSYVKGVCFEAEETVIQYHPKASEYVNFHPYCLHMWRPQVAEILTPPMWMVGPDKNGDLRR